MFFWDKYRLFLLYICDFSLSIVCVEGRCLFYCDIITSVTLYTDWVEAEVFLSWASTHFCLSSLSDMCFLKTNEVTGLLVSVPTWMAFEPSKRPARFCLNSLFAQLQRENGNRPHKRSS